MVLQADKIWWFYLVITWQMTAEENIEENLCELELDKDF